MKEVLHCARLVNRSGFAVQRVEAQLESHLRRRVGAHLHLLDAGRWEMVMGNSNGEW